MPAIQLPAIERGRNHWRQVRRVACLLAAATAGFGAGQLASARALGPVVEMLVSSGTTIIGETIVYPSGAPAKVTAAIVTFAPGQETGWHTHGIPGVAYILEGEVTVDYGEKGTRLYKPGEAILESIDGPHNGRNTGPGPLRILAVFMGADGLPTSKAAPQPQ